MKKISIITLGCKVNMVESEQLAEKLQSDGYDVSMGLGNVSDIYVINTCAVTNEAERKSRNIIAKILKLNDDDMRLLDMMFNDMVYVYDDLEGEY